MTESPSAVLTGIQAGLGAGGWLRSVNFHSTPAASAARYEAQLSRLSRHFCGVDEGDLDRFFAGGGWHKSKPGLIPAFFNGYRNNHAVMKPLLERYGFVGWFFVPSGFVSCAPSEQRAFAAAHGIRLSAGGRPEERVALSWAEVRDLDRSHIVASHTRSHVRVPLDDRAALEREIVGSQRDFESELGHRVASFAWLLGSGYGVAPQADRLLHEAGYRYLFSNFKLQRL